ncbi:MAG: CRISPR-associated protein Cas4, partial [Ktedonobacteraceae bacterium]|nr:CRISPR-associated protein Cas4 [Ktedonobacteraceae bacterium]
MRSIGHCHFWSACTGGVLGEFLDNAHIIEGNIQHERSDAGHTTSEDGITSLRRVWVWSDRLRLSGFADVVEEQEGQYIPIEYKRKMGKWLNDHVQLCAQALCLEEMLGCVIPYGYIFYFGTGRREQVAFTHELHQHTEMVIQQAFVLQEQGTLPPPLVGKWNKNAAAPALHHRCRDCSLEPLCLPREVQSLQRENSG